MMIAAIITGLTLGAMSVHPAPEESATDIWCDELESGDGAMQNCSLQVPGGTLQFNYQEDGLHLTQHVDGQVGWVSFPVQGVWHARSIVRLIDLNADGVEELLIPIGTGNVNTSYLLWQQSATGIFQPAGELSGYGVGPSERVPGLIQVGSRGSAVTHYETAYRLTPDGLEPVYEMVANMQMEACRLVLEPAPDAGLDADALLSACEEVFE
ncbi:hypothetical protein [uncultured Maricaulis sp.]|uniref:hypothetical protein n=1 Tax=uncultured Maricaulis sp. TaxID=174710 RepID=UPI0025DAA1AE|nr:hypothetical protein [uncultured Maricaulis sp.]